jgi:predicted transcriptional regulator
MFKSEKHLSRIIKQVLSNNPSILYDKRESLETFIADEISLGHGIADLVVSFYKNAIKRSLTLTLHDLNVLGVVKKNESTSISEITSSTRTSHERVRNSIRRLQLENLISNKDERIYSANRYVNYQKESFAIEVKLKNWRRALEQAYRYRSFAYHSYVFMDQKFISPALKNKGLFSQYNVGLASVSKAGEIEIHFKPNRGNPFDERLNMLLNENIVTHHLSCRKVSHGSR